MRIGSGRTPAVPNSCFPDWAVQPIRITRIWYSLTQPLNSNSFFLSLLLFVHRDMNSTVMIRISQNQPLGISCDANCRDPNAGVATLPDGRREEPGTSKTQQAADAAAGVRCPSHAAPHVHAARRHRRRAPGALPGRTGEITIQDVSGHTGKRDSSKRLDASGAMMESMSGRTGNDWEPFQCQTHRK